MTRLVRPPFLSLLLSVPRAADRGIAKYARMPVDLAAAPGAFI
jgi:hypothetical protein